MRNHVCRVKFGPVIPCEFHNKKLSIMTRPTEGVINQCCGNWAKYIVGIVGEACVRWRRETTLHTLSRPMSDLYLLKEYKCTSRSGFRSIKDIYNHQLLHGLVSFQPQGLSVQDGTQNSVPAPQSNPAQLFCNIPDPIQEINNDTWCSSLCPTNKSLGKAQQVEIFKEKMEKNKIKKAWWKVNIEKLMWIKLTRTYSIASLQTVNHDEETSCQARRTKGETDSRPQS